MRFVNDILKYMVVALAFWSFTSAAWAAAASRTVAITVVNNTTTPSPGEGKPAGFLDVKCGGGSFQEVRQSQTLVVNCTVSGTDSPTLTYATFRTNYDVFHETTDIDCQSAATLTFSGSFSSVTFTQSCTDTDADSDDGGDSGSDPT